MPLIETEEYLLIPAAAKELHISPSRLWKLIEQKKVNAERPMGGDLAVSRAEIARRRKVLADYQAAQRQIAGNATEGETDA